MRKSSVGIKIGHPRGGNGLVWGQTVMGKISSFGSHISVLKSREMFCKVTDFTWQVVQCIKSSDF